MMGAEDGNGGGFRIWTDLFLIEVLDPETHAPVEEGAVGALVVTPLWTNNVTPFLRWSSGDLVTWHRGDDDSGPFSVFPLVKHAHRTSRFFQDPRHQHQSRGLRRFCLPQCRDRRLQGGARYRARHRDLAGVGRGAPRHRSGGGRRTPENRGARPVRAHAADRRARHRQPCARIRGQREDGAVFRPAGLGSPETLMHSWPAPGQSRPVLRLSPPQSKARPARCCGRGR